MGYGHLPFGGAPETWIARDGLPAAITGDPLREHTTGGWPSAETDDGFVVFENLVVLHPPMARQVMTYPISYAATARRCPRGLASLSPAGAEIYRPCVWRLFLDKGDPRYQKPIVLMERQGSQRELEWRSGLYETTRLTDRLNAGEITQGDYAIAFMEFNLDRLEANKIADRLLESMLGPTQLYEWRIRHKFRCIGGATGKTYRVDNGNGFAEVEPMSDEPWWNYCLHPEAWMPDADVALAAKLHLEDPDLEEEFVAAANGRQKNTEIVRPEWVWDRWGYAFDQERELLE
jgi:hypothetical protein